MRSLIDPVNMTDSDECRPDGLTEPPNQPEGVRGKVVEMEVSEALRVSTRDMGNSSVKMCQPRKPAEPPDKTDCWCTQNGTNWCAWSQETMYMLRLSQVKPKALHTNVQVQGSNARLESTEA